MDSASGADDVPDGRAGDTGPAATDAAPIEPGSLGPHPERHPDDLPPPEPTRPAIPSGILWALALAVVVLTIASWVAFSTESDQADRSDDVVKLDPDFTIGASGLDAPDLSGTPVSTDSFGTFDGATTDLGSYRGRPLVVNFWRSDCPPCIREMPALDRVHQAAGDDVAFVGLTVQDREDDARRLADRTGVTYQLGFDTTGELIRDLGGIYLPTTVFVDAEGTIVDSHAGELSEDDLRERIRANFGIEVPAGS